MTSFPLYMFFMTLCLNDYIAMVTILFIFIIDVNLSI